MTQVDKPMSIRSNKTLFYTTAFMIGLLIVSASGVFFTYFGRGSPSSLSLRELNVDISCKKDSYVVSYVVNADRENGYIAIILAPVTKSPRTNCEGVKIQSNGFDLSQAYSGNWNSFTQKRPESKGVFDGKSSSLIEFDNSELKSRRSFGFIIPVDDLVVDIGDGSWATNVSIHTTYQNANEPELISPNEFSVIIDQDLVITEMNPPLSRGSESGWVIDEHFSTLLENKVEHPRVRVDGSLQLAEDTSVKNTVNQLRLFLKMRSPRYEATQDILLLIFSTLFGVAIGGLIETFLAVSLPRQNVIAAPLQASDQSAAQEEEPEKGGKNPPG